LNNILLGNQWINEEINENKLIETKGNGLNTPKAMEYNKSSSKREVHSKQENVK
jgi:hypothetical protein